ncbi:MAG: hypothetical protein GDA53_08240 [Rhodobacteraceae bacterium]|nr:hypothetical protein [Paracoccaceae bacterium]
MAGSLDGGCGDDTLAGGASAGLFLIDFDAPDVDVIADFEIGVDRHSAFQ